MNKLLTEALSKNNVKFINELNINDLHDERDKKIVKCIKKFNEICASKILQTYGKDIMLYYIDIVINYQKRKNDEDISKYMRNHSTKEDIYFIDPKKDRKEEIFRILKERGHEFLIDKKTITNQEFQEIYKEIKWIN